MIKVPSHKIRLALTMAAVSAVVIVATFWALFDFAVKAAFSAKADELKTALSLLTSDPAEEADIADVRVLNPPVSVAIIDRSGSMKTVVGPAMSSSLPFTQLISDGKARLFEQSQSVIQAKKFRDETLIIGISWRDSSRALQQLGLILSLLWLPLVLLVGVASWFAANGIFRPLVRLSEEADAIGGSDLRQRLMTTDHAEFAQFAERMNRMLDRIQHTVEREDRFAADAAHELRTPLAIMRTRIETTLLRKRTEGEHVAALKQLLSEVDRLSVVVGALLSTARSQLQQAEPIDLTPVLETVVGSWHGQLETGGVKLVANLEPCQVEILPEELEIVVNNLLSNAQRFAPSGSSIRLSLVSNGSLSVEDEGPGLPADLLDSVFERFVRGEDSRNRAAGGLGIGLTLVRRIVESRGGTVAVENVPGARFTIRFPVSSPVAPELNPA